MYAYQNVKSQKDSEQKVSSQTKTNVASLGNQPFSATITQRVEQRKEQTNDLHTVLSDRICRPAENRTGLPDRLKSGVEALSGFRLDDVRVHYHSPKPAQLRAYAYTRGTEIYVAPGQEKHLPHEAWHVVQQMRGRVRPTERINGESVNSSPSLEREASEMGRRALSEPISESSAALVQRQPSDEAAQLSHIARCDEDAQYLGASPENLEFDEKEVVVIECLTDDIERMKRIYAMSCGYDCNTICVFGYNKSVEKSRGGLPKIQLSWNAGPVQHLAYAFSFEWTPIPAESGRGYDFPAVEARRLLMEKAEAIAARLRNNLQSDMGSSATPSSSSSSSSAAFPTFVYRWMDHDAENDSFADHSSVQQSTKRADFLARLSGFKKPVVLGGVYGWRLEEGDREKYAQGTTEFIDELNKSEILLRAEFKKIAHYCGVNVMPTESGLSGCYLPESTILMNEAAHSLAKDVLYPHSDSEAQDKESLRLLGGIDMYTSSSTSINERICFYSVTKPLKFIKDEDKKIKGSYFGTEFFHALYRTDGRAPNVRSLSTPALFFVALKNVRQSVFDNRHWFFVNVGGSDWNGSEPLPSGYGDSFLRALGDGMADKSTDDIKAECQKIFNALRADQAKILWGKYCKYIFGGKPPHPKTT